MADFLSSHRLLSMSWLPTTGRNGTSGETVFLKYEKPSSSIFAWTSALAQFPWMRSPSCSTNFVSGRTSFRAAAASRCMSPLHWSCSRFMRRGKISATFPFVGL